MARFEYDDTDDHLSSVAQSCKYMNAGTKARGITATEGLTCSICSNWDGNACVRKAYDKVLNDLELD